VNASIWSAAGAVLPILAMVCLVRAHRRFAVVTVRGPSMEPTLQDGDRVLIKRVDGRQFDLRVGQIVVIKIGRYVGGPPELSDPFLVIKRLTALPGDPVPRADYPALRHVREDVVPDGCVVVTGDNPAGHDSRQSGYYYLDNLIGVMLRPLQGSKGPGGRSADDFARQGTERR
jgi:signal peptidase I